MSLTKGELKISALIALIRSKYVFSFNEHYNTDTTNKISSVYAEEGIPLMFSNKTRYEELSGSIKGSINSLSGKLSGNHENNGKKVIYLDDYKEKIDYNALEELLRTFNLKRPSNILGTYGSFDSIMFDCLDSAFHDCSDGLNSAKKDVRAKALKEVISVYRTNLKRDGLYIYNQIKSDVDLSVDDIFDLDDTLDILKDKPAKLMICSRKDDGSKEMLASLDYFGNSKYSATILIENKHLSEAELLLASGLIMKYMDRFEISVSESNQERIVRYIKNANFLKDNLHYINYMLMMNPPIPTSAMQEKVPVLI